MILKLKRFLPNMILKKHTFVRFLSCPCDKPLEKPYQKVFTMNAINVNAKHLDSFCRSHITRRVDQLTEEIAKGKCKHPLKEIIRTHVGDGHAVGQKPITFVRQLVATVTNTELFDDNKIPDDVKERARLFLSTCSGQSVGSYTESVGVETVRKHTAEYIQNRDQYLSDLDNIFVFSGFSDLLKHIILILSEKIEGKRLGMMLPVPHDPLYSACAVKFDVSKIPYYLNESEKWSINMQHLKDQIDSARKFCRPLILIIINPGNPTGQVFNKETLEDFVKFAYQEKLLILADETYQENICDENVKFISIKKVMNDLGEPYKNMECLSFMSVSNGYAGERGFRAGSMELFNINADVKEIITKLFNTTLCSMSLGQAAFDAVMKPPQKDEPSYKLFAKEREEIFGSLKTTAKLANETMNTFKGFKCNHIEAAVYAFPKITLPPLAIEVAEKEKITPDTFFCMKLLEETGIATLPGSEFGLKQGIHHFRISLLPPVEKFKNILQSLKKFSEKFYEKYK